MAEILVEKAVCEGCGTDIRDGSSFCYHCGESVVTGPPPPAILKPDNSLLNGRDTQAAKTVAFSDPEPAPISIPQRRLEEPAPVASKTEKLQTAASIRRRTKVRNKKTVEVEWVERSSSSPIFILAAVLLAVFAGLMLAAALYLR